MSTLYYVASKTRVDRGPSISDCGILRANGARRGASPRQAELAPRVRGGKILEVASPVVWLRGSASNSPQNYEESRSPTPPASKEVISVTARSGRGDCCIRRASSSCKMLPIHPADRVARNARIETQNASRPPASCLLPEQAERHNTEPPVLVRPPRLRCSARYGTLSREPAPVMASFSSTLWMSWDW